jgi:histidinol dehydrogenase
MRRLSTRDSGFESEFRRLCERRLHSKERVAEVVSAIVADVRERGDDALLDATLRYDGYRLTRDQIRVGPREQEEAVRSLGVSERDALRLAAERIRRFHEAQVPRSWRLETSDDLLGQEVRPLTSVGIYVPAAKAPLASTALMLGVPASVAGVRNLQITTPGRSVHPAILEAARLSGVAAVFRVGGAQAVAALAYGTESISRVDKIVGPGNVYVQAAKRQVFGDVDIDCEAGPSEVLVVATAEARPALVAADLVAQAEHEELASAVLATPSADLARDVLSEVELQLRELPRAPIARASLATRGALIVTRDLEEALDLANRFAPEHLELFMQDAERWLPRVEHAGAVFLGPMNPVPLGDYIAGPSHVLPTGGTARFFSALGVEAFLKRISVIRLGNTSLEGVGPHAARLAEMEGLEGHARAIRMRLRKE